MTHDELLAKLSPARYIIKEEAVAQLNALRAVVELHKPEGRNVQPLTRCWKCQVTYPCAEIQAIEKELS